MHCSFPDRFHFRFEAGSRYKIADNIGGAATALLPVFATVRMVGNSALQRVGTVASGHW